MICNCGRRARYSHFEGDNEVMSCNKYAICPKPDVYETIDSINTSVDKVDSIIDDAKQNDPEFYNELKNIASNALIEHGGE